MFCEDEDEVVTDNGRNSSHTSYMCSKQLNVGYVHKYITSAQKDFSELNKFTTLALWFYL
jgi:hypothetical protein